MATTPEELMYGTKRPLRTFSAHEHQIVPTGTSNCTYREGANSGAAGWSLSPAQNCFRTNQRERDVKGVVGFCAIRELPYK